MSQVHVLGHKYEYSTTSTSTCYRFESMAIISVTSTDLVYQYSTGPCVHALVQEVLSSPWSWMGVRGRIREYLAASLSAH